MDENMHPPTEDIAEVSASDYLDITTNVVSSYLSRNHVPAAELPGLIASVHAAFAEIGEGADKPESPAEKPTPAQIRKSITPDTLISFIDGKPYKTLKRHLTRHGLTMDEYREHFGLPRDYPSTAPEYSAARSSLARQSGLGRRQRPGEAELANDV
ncbi:MucR family transcriptional regulator [Methylobacterium oryzae CBMB20]